MLINFKSIAKQNEKENIIEFSSHLDFEDKNNWYLYRFTEPSNKIGNLIEVKKNGLEVKIFAGPTALDLELDNDVEIIYKMGNNQFIVYTNMQKLKINSEKEICFSYLLKNNKKETIGEFDIFLNIKE